jgi:hypothetical protein
VTALTVCSVVLSTFRGLYEVQNISVQITNTELAGSVEGVINVLYKLDTSMIVRLTRKRSLRRFELGF